jgi:hypothetical protein
MSNWTPAQSRDVSENIAHEVRRRSDLQLTELPECLANFARHEIGYRKQQLTLRLV